MSGVVLETEVCIVGGGMVGAALALAFARSGRQVVLWERQLPEFVPGELGMGVRTVALSPASERWLTELGVRVEGAPMVRMHVREELGTATLEFSAAEIGVPRLGRIVENDRLVAVLWTQVRNCEGITVWLDADLHTVQPASDAIHLTGSQGTVAARLCIAADGAASRVRMLTGQNPRRIETGQSALATVVRTSRPHEGLAFQRFLQDGPVALLPGVQPDLCAVVWSQPPELAAARAAADPAEFASALARATQHVFGDVTAVDHRLTFPLVQQIAAGLTPASRVVLTGDAARVLHPLAGMGVNLGFEDAALLGRLCASADDPGAPAALAVYARRRSLRSAAIVGLMSGFQEVFGWQAPAPVWLRSIGMRFVGRQPWMKHQILREALGLGPIATASR